jgi:DNA-binding response OmpR family regulator
MTGPSSILLVMGDDLLRQSVAEHLSRGPGYRVSEARCPQSALDQVPGHHLVVVDEGAGSDPCRMLRDGGVTLPLLLLGQVGAGGACADAVLPKPLRLGLLAGRIAELLASPPDPAGLRIGPWRLDGGRRLLTDDGGKSQRLTDKEAAILARLAQAGGVVVARDTLLAEVWGYGGGIDTHTLETHVYRLRRKLGAPDLLVSEDGGYRLTS